MNILTRIRESYFTKGLAALLALNMLFEFIWPTTAMALTSGPSQPEVQSFEPVETTDMVNMFTGDFTYNIPLIYLPGPNGGYPINLAYHGGIGMDQEASWVGLGWNINAGALVRDVRGFADDYNGDLIKTKVDMKENWTAGLSYGANIEAFGGDANINPNSSIRYNNYKGFGYSTGIGIGSTGDANMSMGISLDSETGLGFTVNASTTGIGSDKSKHSLGLSYNNEGLGLSFSREKQGKKSKTVTGQGSNGESVQMGTLTRRTNVSGSSSIGFSANKHVPNFAYSTNTNSFNFSFKMGGGPGAYSSQVIGGFHNVQTIDPLVAGKVVDKSVYGFEHLENAENTDMLDFGREKDGQVTPMTPNIASPQLTYDVYSVLGQGISGMFRPFRTDVGRVHDPKMYSVVFGGSGTYDISGVAVDHVGGGGTGTSGHSVQKPWDYKNDWKIFEFEEQKEYGSSFKYSDEERIYYRMHGDKSTYETDELDFIGGVSPVLTESTASNDDKLGTLNIPVGIENERPSTHSKRIPRNTVIHKFTNRELRNLYGSPNPQDDPNLGAHPDLGETSIYHYSWPNTNWLPSQGINPQDPDEFLRRDYRDGTPVLNQNGAYKVLNEDGQYYVYGLPAYNVKEVQNSFSVDNNLALSPGANPEYILAATDKVEFNTTGSGSAEEVDYKMVNSVGNPNTHESINKVTKPAYAHSYMLTSILGADYVDKSQNGPTDDDLGYWVKLDYVKYADDYKWRAPYDDALYNPGSLYSGADDQGTYTYGEKELWYVSRIETKTHILVFTLGERNDYIESGGEFVGGQGTQSGLLIEKISLYKKDEYNDNASVQAQALQEVHFEYNYDLCQGVLNNDNGTSSSAVTSNNGGKLTLKKVWFTYEGSSKGEMRPYVFDYYNESSDPIDYSEFEYDRWGNYKPSDNTALTEFNHKNLPYVNQFETQQDSDENASAWSLKTISLPSGGQIDMTYEADDYAYVQSEVATQMMPITFVNDDQASSNLLYPSGGGGNNYVNDPRTRRIYFKLEDIVPTINFANENARASYIYEKYLRGLIIDGKGDRNLYFKNYTQLRDSDDDSYAYVSGYAAIENYNDDGVWTVDDEFGNPFYMYGMTESIPGNGYDQGFLTLKKQIKKMEFDDSDNSVDIIYSDDYHPMAMAAWEHIRLNEPLLLSLPPQAWDGVVASAQSNGQKADQVASLIGMGPQIVQMFSGVWKYCRNNNMGRRIKVGGESVIRLCSPDKKKIGGGQRVKQIAITDNWNAFSGEASATNGVTYDYTKTIQVNGQDEVISSGVAQYEPLWGGDENPMRYPKFYPDNHPFKSNSLTYFEHPINEHYFPAPQVGYSRVAVRSINTKNQMDNQPSDQIGTTGVTEYEFYTAKEFPVITKETEIKKRKLNLPIPLPFIGVYSEQNLKVAQGYSIELNDMHGQLKSIKKFGLNSDYTMNQIPTSSVEYYYNANHEYQMKMNNKYIKQVSRLENEVDCISADDGINDPTIGQRIIGVEYDFFTDQRQNKSHTITAGAYANSDLIGTYPIPSVWPAFSSVKRDLKTFVTNKVIFKSGIVSEVHTYDGRARVITKNEVYDAQTGRPILTSVNNEFEDIVYNYSHPAHWEYDRMGGAYKNIDLKFQATLIDPYVNTTGLEGQFILQSDTTVISQLVSGDQFYVDDKYTAIYIKDLDDPNGDKGIVYVDDETGSLPSVVVGEKVWFKVIRSGRKNHVFTDAGTLVAKQNPLLPGARTTVSGGIVYNENIANNSETHLVHASQMNKVINSTAVLFKDEWESSNEDDRNKIPFLTGEAGIWRPYKSYIFVGDRNSGPSVGVPDIQNSGEMDDVYLFRWQIENIEKYMPQWQWTTEITKYSNEAYELENLDRLGIYSAALYAHHGSLVVAVGANASYHEIGAEDFERYPIDGTSVTSEQMAEDDNLGFHNSLNSSSYFSEFSKSYEVLGGRSLANGQFDIELETTDQFANNDELQLTLKTSVFSSSANSDSYVITAKVVSSSISSSSGNTVLKVESFFNFVNNGAQSILGVGSYVSGKATVYKEIQFSGLEVPDPLPEFVSEKAHTGKQSMKFEGDQELIFPQGKLDLKKDKAYVFSAWFSLEDDRKIDFSDIFPDVRQKVNNVWTSLINNSPNPYVRSKVIEGWQKIEFEFIPFEDDSPIAIFLSYDHPQNEKAYVDDIRISPKIGGIVTYVYDNSNYRLKAILDDNNYATKYFYDEEGNLHLVKKETERGIQTVSENRGHTKIQ